MREEIWKDVVGFEGFYMVSNLGRVRSLDRIVVNRLSRSYPIAGRIMRPGVRKKNGYYSVDLTTSNNAKHYSVHRLVAKAFIPNPNNLPSINHIDGDHFNNSVQNLEWTTNEYNELHAKENGLKAKGERHAMHKLKTDDVIAIRSLAKAGVRPFEIQKIYNKVTLATICNIKNKKNWAWVE